MYQLGPNAKGCGTTFVKGYSHDGKHKNISGIKKMMRLHCEDTGRDFDFEWKNFQQQNEENQQKQKKEATGKVEARKQEARKQTHKTLKKNKNEEYIGDGQQAV